MSGRGDVKGLPMPFDASELPSAWTTDDLLRFHRARGARIFEFRGNPWVMGRTRFCMPLAWWLPTPASEIAWPSRTALGFQAVVDDAALANGTITLLGISNLADYGAHWLNQTRRYEVRRAMQSCEFAVLRDDELLVRQGWETLRAASAVSGQWTPPHKSDYQALSRASFMGERPLIVAALQNGNLQAYTVSYCHRETAYLSDVVVPPAVRGIGVGSALYWITISMWSQAPGVARFTAGRTIREKPTLDSFKRSLGSREFDVPVVSHMREPVRSYLRRSRPVTYERLCGVSA